MGVLFQRCASDQRIYGFMAPEIVLDPSRTSICCDISEGGKGSPARSATYYMHVQTLLLFPSVNIGSRKTYLWGWNRFPLVFKGAEIHREQRRLDEWQLSGFSVALIRAKRILSLKHEQMVWLQEFQSSASTESAVFSSVIVINCFIRAFFGGVEGQSWEVSRQSEEN